MSRRTTKTYPLEFKQSSAKLAGESDRPIVETAKDLGVNPTTLYGWVQKFNPRTGTPTEGKSPIEEELKRLRLENIRLKQQRDILKKAAAYFASEM